MIAWLDCSRDGEVFPGLVARAVDCSSTDSWHEAARRTADREPVERLFEICPDLWSQVCRATPGLGLCCI